ncbi:hypothetical protein Lser_V15G45605 [Lactuca serriola]
MAKSTINFSDPIVLPVSSPFYIGSSDNPSSILVTNIFNGVGFIAWCRSMTIALSTKKKPSFFDGSNSQPAPISSSYSNWYHANSMKEINQRYEQSSGAVTYEIQQQLCSITQGSDDFSTYYMKLMKKLIQLLMGLNDSYKIIRGQILMMKPLPSMSTAYALIVQEEHQREVHYSTVLNSDAMDMQISSSKFNNSSKRTLNCTHYKKNGHTKTHCSPLVEFPTKF